MNQFTTIDWIVFFGYASIIVILGLWVSCKRRGPENIPGIIFSQSFARPGWAIDQRCFLPPLSRQNILLACQVPVMHRISNCRFMNGLQLPH